METFRENPVLIMLQISGVLRAKCVGLEQIPIHQIAITIVSSRAVNARPDFPGARAGQTQIVDEKIQILIVDRISQCRGQHAFRVRRSAKNAATVTPSDNRLECLDRVDYYIRTLGATIEEEQSGENN